MSKKEDIENLVRIATSDGNWNYDPYLHGMANGMLLIQSIVNNTDPIYLEAPDDWLKDLEPGSDLEAALPESEKD